MEKLSKTIQILIINLILLITLTSSLQAQELPQGEAGGGHGSPGKADTNPVVHTVENNQVKFSVTLNPGVSTVGHLTKITGQIMDKATGRPVTNVRVQIDALHIEDNKTMLHTEFLASDGSFSFENQFFDGAEHLLTVTAEPANSSSVGFVPLKNQFTEEVIGVQPPTDVKIKTMVFLLALVAAGMAAGAAGAKSRKSRRFKGQVYTPSGLSASNGS